jgi:hypothetical protein
MNPAKSILVLLAAAAMVPCKAPADPMDAERFTHIAGFNLADGPSFDDYGRKFGSTPVDSTGDGAESESRVCYRSVQGDMVVEFFHGEVDWGFSLRRPRKGGGRCPIATGLSDDQLRIEGVALGMRVFQYKEKTGKPASETASRIKHRFEYVHVLTDAELGEMMATRRKNGYPPESQEALRRWDVGITLTGDFANGRLVSFSVDRVETN